jgi:hypothetical protein
VRNWIGAVLFLSVLAALGYYPFYALGLNLWFNGDTSYFYQHRDLRRGDGEINLVPTFVKVGDNKQKVEERLTRSGFEPWGTKYTEVPVGAKSVLNFRLLAGARNLFCSSELYLTFAFDSNDSLHSGFVEQGGVCL